MWLIGKEVRGIKILQRTGSGGVGTVYRGRVLRGRRGLSAGTEVAVKVLHEHLTGDPASVSRFKLEAGLGLTFKHPNIVRIFQVGSDRVQGIKIHYLVQEFIHGITLKQLVRESGALGDAFLRKIARQVAEALSQIHSRKIIHRDLKPENVFIEKDGVVKVVDFGFSLVEKRLRDRSSDSGFLGTVAYAAPERFGPHRPTAAADLYAFGVMLYELAVGEHPFLGKDLAATISNHMERIPPEPARINPSISPFMSLLIMALLEKTPAARLGPSSRLARILVEEERARWWRRVRPDNYSGSVSPRRQALNVVRRTPVYGREEELALLVRLAREAVSGSGCRAACILGEAGSGKTRLVDRLLEEMDREGLPGRMLIVEGGQGTVKVPYLPLITGLQAVFDLQGVERETLRSALKDRLAGFFPGQARLTERFAHFLISAIPSGAEVEEIMLPDQVGRLFGALFAAMAKAEPLILLMENLKDADPPTLRVVSTLLPDLAESPVIVIATSRSEEAVVDKSRGGGGLSAFIESARAVAGGRIIELKRLGGGPVNRMLDYLGFTGSEARDGFREKVLTLSEGNPYFVLTIARHIVEGIHPDGDVPQEGKPDLEIPPTIRDLFRRRLERIGPLERDFLSFASVIGLRFKTEEVVEGLGLDFETAVRTVSGLQNRFALIRPVHGLYRFDHVLIREILYREMDPEDRAYYHRKAGDRYRRLAKKRSLTGREWYKGAVHYFRGKDFPRALAYFPRAFDYLRFKQYHERAFQLAELAAKHLVPSGEKGGALDAAFVCDLFLKQAEVSDLLGRRAAQFAALRKALQAARDADSPPLDALVRLRIGQYYLSTSRLISALNFIQSALTRMRALGDQRGEADALQTLSRILMEMGEGEEILGHLRQALRIRRALGDAAGQAAVLVEMGTYYQERDKPVAAHEAYLRAQRLFRSLRNDRGLAAVLLGLGRIDMAGENPENARRVLEEADRMAREVGDVSLEADVLSARGILHLMRSEIAEASPFFCEALQLAARIKDRVRQARILSAQGRLLVHPANRSPDPEMALAKAREAIVLTRKIGMSMKERVSALNTLAAVFLAMQRPLSAYAIYRLVLRILTKEGGPPDWLEKAKGQMQHLTRKLKRGRERISP